MAVIKKRVDDYLYNSKGEENRDARKASISIPGLAFGGTRAKKHDLDLSEKGEKAMLRERERLEAQTQKLWADWVKNVGFDAEKHAAKTSADKDTDDGSSEGRAPSEPDATEDSPDPDTEEDLEAATSPSAEQSSF